MQKGARAFTGEGTGVRGRYGGRYGTFLSQESTKEPASDVKAAGFKLEGGTAAPPPWQVKA